MKAYYNKTDLVLVVEVENFLYEDYDYYKIKPIPINKTRIIKTNSNNLILNLNNYMEVSKTCQIVELVYYCQKEQIYSTKGSCIPEILRNRDISCETTQIQPKYEIKLIEDGYLSIASEDGVKIETN